MLSGLGGTRQQDFLPPGGGFLFLCLLSCRPSQMSSLMLLLMTVNLQLVRENTGVVKITTGSEVARQKRRIPYFSPHPGQRDRNGIIIPTAKGQTLQGTIYRIGFFFF